MTLSYVARPLHPSARLQSDRPAVIFAGKQELERGTEERDRPDSQQDLCRRCPRFGQNDERRIGPRDEKKMDAWSNRRSSHLVGLTGHMLYAAERLSVPSSAPA